jgi:hypothetical protein
MKLLRRILTTIAITFAVILVCVYWIAPVALSFDAARKAPPVAKVVPTELTDHSISQAPGRRLSYVGYDFEVPWDDIDESKTQLYPKSSPAKTMVVLVFRSGLKIMVTSLHPREFAYMWEKDYKMPARNMDAIFGTGSANSDYIFTKNVWAFTPDKMHHWSLTPAMYARETMLLMFKSVMPSRAARSGIFNVRTRDYMGFQQGNRDNLEVARDGVLVTLFANDGGVEFLFDADHCDNPVALTQPKINRVVQTLRKTVAPEMASSAK